MRRILPFLFTLLIATMPLRAEPIPGSEAPDYEAAVAAWLAGEDDLAVLTSLSELARAENAAAQMLLARIGELPHLVTHVTGNMPRAERIALLRSPGGLSGRSWMISAAQHVPLAQAFVDSTGQDTRVDSLRILYEAGEVAAATRSLPGLLAYGTEDLVRAMQDLDVMPDEARVLIAAAAATELYWASGERIDIANPISDRRPPELALIWRPVTPREWQEDPATRELALAHSLNIASLAPLRAFCASECQGELGACMAAGASLLAVSAAPLPFASPSETLIPTETYWDSPRFDADLRRLLSGIADPEAQPGYVAMNACFMQAASR